MMTLLASLLGFVSSAFPDLLKLWRDAADRKHELAILQMQMEQAAQGHQQRLEEIGVHADIAESKALYKLDKPIGIDWVDSLRGSVRPILTYAFFAAYVLFKYAEFQAIQSSGLPWLNDANTWQQVAAVWKAEDSAIFAGIMSYWFGSRGMEKARRWFA
tara:strand:- start:118 stop:594 length:477 start_codon:yes stop_codon:yes gene_type:complete